jgi:hypothetical protein
VPWCAERGNPGSIYNLARPAQTISIRTGISQASFDALYERTSKLSHRAD